MQATATTIVSMEEIPLEFIDVVFKRNDQGEIKGVIVRDCKKVPLTEVNFYACLREEHSFDWETSDSELQPYRVERSKIVFVYGYLPERATTWQGNLPKNEEEWTCEVIKDTKPDDPRRGALIVKLITNLTAFKKAQRRKEEERLSVIIRQQDGLDPMGENDLSITKAQAIEKFALAFAEKRGMNNATETLKVFWSYPASIYDLGCVPTHHQKEVAEIVRKAQEIGVHYKILTFRARIWLEHLLKTGLGETTFAYLGKRDVKCHNCGGTMKFSKEEKEKFAQGEKILLVCEHCAYKGLVQ